MSKIRLKKKYLFFLAAALLCSDTNAEDSLRQAKIDLEILTSKELAGRGFMLGGHKKAAEFLKERFKNIGLKAIIENYSQGFPVEANIVEPFPFLIINDKEMIPGSDYLPGATTGSGESDNEYPLYVKSGLFIPEKNINDYSDVKEKGTILLIDETVPDSIKNDKTINPEFYSRETRLHLAENLECSAVIFLVEKLMYSSPRSRRSIPVIDLLKTSLPDLPEKIQFSVESSFENFEAENIIGLVPGTSAGDSVIIICAHYDHMGGFADSLYFPGANDNGSGTAMLLLLAEYFKNNPGKNSILFIAFSGEETGLLGSRYYTEHPLLPLEKTKFLVNLDMVASGDDGVMAVGGTNHPEFFEILNNINDSLGIAPLYKRPTAPNGDHFYFSEKEVKTFFFYANSGKQPYHNFRDIPETVDWKAFDHIFKLTKAFIKTINQE